MNTTEREERLKSVLSEHRAFAFDAAAGGVMMHNADETIAEITQAFIDSGWHLNHIQNCGKTAREHGYIKLGPTQKPKRKV